MVSQVLIQEGEAGVPGTVAVSRMLCLWEYEEKLWK